MAWATIVQLYIVFNAPAMMDHGIMSPENICKICFAMMSGLLEN